METTEIYRIATVVLGLGVLTEENFCFFGIRVLIDLMQTCHQKPFQFISFKSLLFLSSIILLFKDRISLMYFNDILIRFSIAIVPMIAFSFQEFCQKLR